MRILVQNGTDDKIHDDRLDHNEIELTTCLNELGEKAKYQNMKEKAEKIVSKPKNPKKSNLTKLQETLMTKFITVKKMTTTLSSQHLSNGKGLMTSYC